MRTNLDLREQTMTSLEIAELTGKPHNDVLKAIRKMEPAWTQVTQGKFSLSSYQDATGRTLPCYQLTKTECLYIATKFNDEARARLVLRWEELERGRLTPVPSPAGEGGTELMTLTQQRQVLRLADQIIGEGLRMMNEAARPSASCVLRIRNCKTLWNWKVISFRIVQRFGSFFV